MTLKRFGMRGVEEYFYAVIIGFFFQVALVCEIRVLRMQNIFNQQYMVATQYCDVFNHD